MALRYKSPTNQPTLRVVMRPPFCTEYTSPPSPLNKNKNRSVTEKEEEMMGLVL